VCAAALIAGVAIGAAAAPGRASAPASAGGLAAGRLARSGETVLERAGAAMGVRALVRCQSQVEHAAATARWGERYGLTFLDGAPPTIELAPEVCQHLLRARRFGLDDMDVALGVAVLAHELGHAGLGTRCEYEAERYAMARWRRLFRVLGFGRPTAMQVDAVRFAHDALPPEYLTPCS
jgi:hypothetical protein